MAGYQVIIKPNSRNFALDFSEIWRYRELFYIFAWRDIKVRYKQTVLGVAWAIFQPLITMVIFTYFFGKVVKVPSGNLPYFLFVFIGLIFWNFFANTLNHASNSMIENEGIIKKVYFPKVILPFSSVATSFVDLVVNLLMLIVALIFFRYLPSPMIILILPLGIIITGVAAGGLGLFLSSINVKYRDVRYILPFFIQLLLFITPVIYPISIVTPVNKFFLSLNPMTGVIESMRSVISNSPIDYQILFISSVSAIFFALAGLAYFRRTERFFADIV